MKGKNYINIALILIWLIVIFSFSAEDSEKSTETSGQVIIKTAETIKQEELTPKEKENILNKFFVPVRKSAHFFLYFVLGILTFWLAKDLFGLKPLSIFLTIAFCFIYACSDEIHQLFVPGRSGQFTDVLVDTTGSLLSVSIIYLACKIREKRMIKLK